MTESRPDSSTRDRRPRDVLFAVGCLFALAAAAVLVPHLGASASIGGGFGSGIGGLDAGNSLGAGDGDVARTLGDGLGATDSSPLAGTGTSASGGGSESESESESGETAIGADDETTAGSSENPFQNGSAAVQFTVDSERADYWRIDAYDHYTGQSWERTGDHRDYPGELRPEGPVTGTMTQEVTLEAPAGALPGAWQPRRVDVRGEADLSVSSQGGVHAEGFLPAGTTYTIESYRYAPEPDALRAAGTEYPDAVDRRYTRLPAETPDRVHDLASEITADAETAYDAADAIDRWIETNKNYSLEAEHDPDGRPVDEYLFEMDAGYCQYSASSMVVLLRSQDIPARYVTGYAPGTVAEGGGYEVRSANAHAWVEVYFPDHGWVRFDPTPAEERLEEERADLEEAGTDEQLAHAPSVNDDPSELGEAYRNGTVSSVDGWEPSGDGEGWEPSDDSSGGSGEFDDTNGSDGFGDTNSSGEFDDPDGEPGERGDWNGTTDDGDGGEDEGDDSSDGDETAAEDVDEGDVTDETDETGETGENGQNEDGDRDGDDRDDADTPFYDVSLSPAEPIPGTEATATVTRFESADDATGEPVSGATVRFNGESIGKTDANGRVTGTVPFEDSLEVSVSVPDAEGVEGEGGDGGGTDERSTAESSSASAAAAFGAGGSLGPLASIGSTDTDAAPASNETTRTYTTVSDLEIGVSTSPLVAGGETAVRVTIRGTPVPEATVAVDGETVGETDSEGRLSVPIPDDASGAENGTVSLSARRDGLSAERTVPVETLVIEADHEYGLPLPTRAATLTVTAGNETLSGVAIIGGDGSAVGTTDGDGTVTTKLPLENEVTYGVAYDGGTAELEVDRLFGIAAAVVGAGLGVLVGLLLLARRLGVTPRRVATAARSTIASAIDFVVLATARFDSLLELVVARVRGGWASLRALPGELYARFQAWRPDSVLGAIRARLAAVVARLQSAVSRSETGSNRNVTAAGESTDGTDGANERVRSTVRRAWQAFVGMVSRSRSRWRTKTPGEVARTATAMGFPERQVYELTDAFRETEYGDGVSRERAADATDALEYLQKRERERERERAAAGSESRSEGDERTEDAR
ncbi:transglutaminaseTgpA domain-containing protein [Halomontanus rarus]|uniref:transglutaminaseTgpA domain-containing protein n=1 Tax=Halomontanus rarus TaxID=3034020 RepID=UPI001A982681